LTGLALWSRMMAGLPWCFGRYLSRICLSLSIVFVFAKPVERVQSCRRNGMETTRGAEAVDSGIAATRKSEGLTRQRPAALTTVAVRRFSRAIVPLTVRPSSVSNSTTIPTENRASWVRLLADRMSCSRSMIRWLSSISSSSESLVRSIAINVEVYQAQTLSLDDRVLRRYVLEDAKLSELGHDLRMLGITETSVYPDLDALARELTTQF
jgi:hypothetical protein